MNWKLLIKSFGQVALIGVTLAWIFTALVVAVQIVGVVPFIIAAAFISIVVIRYYELVRANKREQDLEDMYR